MSVVMSNNFNGTPGDAFTGDSVYTLVAGAGNFVASHYGVGVRCPANGQLVLSESFSAVTGPRVFSRIYKLSAIPSGAGSEVWQVRAAPAGASKAHNAVITSAGKLTLFNAAGTALGTSTNPLPIGVEFRVVYTINAAGTTLSAAIYPDTTSTTPTQTLSGACGAISIDRCRDGVLNAAALGTATLDIIWPVDDNAVDPGLRQYVYFVPDRVGGIVPKTVSVTVYDENLPAGTKTYSMDWGDGHTSAPQSSPNFTHTYDVGDLSVAGGRWPMVAHVDVT